MCAWLLALFCLVSTDLSLVRTNAPPAELVVYLSVNPTQPQAPLNNMKRELSALMDAAGYRIVWGDPRNPDRSGQASNMVMLELRGSCGLEAGNYRVDRAAESGASLAETSVSADGVLPFSWINCANMTRMVGPALIHANGAQRDFRYGRAMARAAAHEFYHVMTGSRDHGHEGVAKARFTTADLLDERFDFDPAELAGLRQKAGEAAPEVRSEPAPISEPSVVR